MTGNAALRPTGVYHGVGEGGGLYLDTPATAYLDAFTVANVLNNTATTSYPNIYGSYKHLH